MIHKGWKIEKVYFGYYEATNLKDCDASIKFGKNICDLIIEIDEEL